MAKNLRWTVIHNKVNGLWWNRGEWSHVAQAFTTKAVADHLIVKHNLVPNEVETMDWAIYDAEWQGYWECEERTRLVANPETVSTSTVEVGGGEENS